MINEIIAYKTYSLHDDRLRPAMNNPHYHDNYELYFFLGDIMQYFLGSRVFNLKKYDLVVVDRLTYHRTQYSMSKDPVRINVTFGKNIVDGIENSEYRTILSKFLSTVNYIDGKNIDVIDIGASFEHLTYLCSKKEQSPLLEYRKRHVLLDILFSLLDLGDRPSKYQRETENDDMTKIVEHINAFFNQEVNLAVVSEKFGISRFHLCRKFKEATGSCITDYVNMKRLTEAKKLLLDTDYSVNRISDLVGYNNTSYFIRIYKKTYGKSPGEYRKGAV